MTTNTGSQARRADEDRDLRTEGTDEDCLLTGGGGACFYCTGPETD